jgi:hypothetical protein
VPLIYNIAIEKIISWIIMAGLAFILRKRRPLVIHITVNHAGNIILNQDILNSTQEMEAISTDTDTRNLRFMSKMAHKQHYLLFPPDEIFDSQSSIHLATLDLT